MGHQVVHGDRRVVGCMVVDVGHGGAHGCMQVEASVGGHGQGGGGGEVLRDRRCLEARVDRDRLPVGVAHPQPRGTDRLSAADGHRCTVDPVGGQQLLHLSYPRIEALVEGCAVEGAVEGRRRRARVAGEGARVGREARVVGADRGVDARRGRRTRQGGWGGLARAGPLGRPRRGAGAAGHPQQHPSYAPSLSSAGHRRPPLVGDGRRASVNVFDPLVDSRLPHDRDFSTNW